MPALRALPLLLAATACVAAPAAAPASTVSSDGSLITFVSGARASDMAVTGNPAFGTYTLVDAADALSAGAGCAAEPLGVASCSGVNFDVRLGGGADRAKVLAVADIAQAGGSGDDELYAWGNGATLSGGVGDDVVVTDTNGSASAAGNGGADTLYARGFGGTVSGGEGDDLVVGDGAEVNALSGGGGADAVVALRGGSAGVTLDGGAGDDALVGGPAVDAVFGAGGRDVIDVSGDGQADSVACGAGVDTVRADAQDTVAADCERRLGGGDAAPAAVVAAAARAAALTADVATIDPRAPGPLLPSA